MLHALSRLPPLFAALTDNGIACALVNATAERLVVSVMMGSGTTYTAEFDEVALQRIKSNGSNTSGAPISRHGSTVGHSSSSTSGLLTWQGFFDLLQETFTNGFVMVQKPKLQGVGGGLGIDPTTGSATGRLPSEGSLGSVQLVCMSNPAGVASVPGSLAVGLTLMGEPVSILFVTPAAGEDGDNNGNRGSNVGGRFTSTATTSTLIGVNRSTTAARSRVIFFLLQEGGSNIHDTVRTTLMEYQHLQTHVRMAQQEVEDLSRQEGEYRALVESLEREAKTLRESIGRSKEQDSSNRARLADLQAHLVRAEEEHHSRNTFLNETGRKMGVTGPTVVDKREGNAAGDHAVEDGGERGMVATAATVKRSDDSIRVRNPLGEKRHKDYDKDLLRLIKSKWLTAETAQLGAVSHRVIRPYTFSELAVQIRNFSSPVRESIWNALEKLDDWDYNVFSIQSQMSGDDNHSLASQPRGGSLMITVFSLLLRHGIMQRFNIDEQIALNWISVVEAGYQGNPYHNSMHAADVAHIVHYILTKGGMTEVCSLSPEYVFAAIFSAAIHDYDHPGINNNFHVKTQSYLAYLYNDRSVLENHHLFCVFELMRLPQFDILHSFSEEQRRELRETIISMVLATDMGLHGQYVTRFKARLAENRVLTAKEDQRLAMAMVLKMADISNCGRPLDIYLKWSSKVSDEFYMQGDRERNMGLPCSPFMDRMQPVIAKGQIAFMSYIVVPFFELIAELLPEMQFAVRHAEDNKAYWAQHPSE